MSQPGDWSPDESSSGEAFEQGDEARDERERTDPDFAEDAEVDPSLDPTLQVDDRELEEAGAEFDDPEGMSTLGGGLDDPDGIGGPTPGDRARAADTEGWDLDAPEVPGREDAELDEL